MWRFRKPFGNFLFVLWLLLFVKASTAASFKEEVLGYDVESLMWAALMALFGGTLRTIFTLAAENKIVTNMLREGWKDVLVAIVAGFLVYITIEAIRAMNVVPIPSEVRFAAIVFAGWSRMSFFGWINQLGTRTTNAVTDAIVGRVQVLSGAKSHAPPTSVPPLTEKPKPFKETVR